MRVLLAGWKNRHYYGGLEVHIQKAFEVFREYYEDVEIFLAVPRFDDTLTRKRTEERIVYISIKSDNFFDSALEYSRKLAQWAKRKRMDIIHTHDWLSANAGIFLKNAGIKWVHTHHSLWFARQFFEYGQDKIRQIEINANKADFVFTVSNLMKKECESREIRIDKIVHGGGMLEFKSAKIGNTSNEKFFLYAGRLSKAKGVDILLAAFAKYVNNSTVKRKLVITGEGELKSRMTELISMLKLEKYVEFMGFVEPSILERLYIKCHAFIHPAYFEPYGISLVDAAQIEKPLVCCKRCGALEVIDGAMVLRGITIEEIFEALIRLDEIQKTTNLNRSVASWKNVADAYANAYCSV